MLENIKILILCLTSPPHVCSQWEARVTQYERDFDRIGVTVRKEVLRFEVCLCFIIAKNNVFMFYCLTTTLDQSGFNVTFFDTDQQRKNFATLKLKIHTFFLPALCI